MAQFAPYAMTWHGVAYDQFDQLPTLTATAAAFMERTGRAVGSAGVTASRDIVVAGTPYASGASLAALSPVLIRRLLRSRRAH